MDYYPIPVISVSDLCDLEIEFDRIGFSTKLSRKSALCYPFKKLENYDFEAYGVLDYLADYYVKGNSIEDLRQNIFQCSEEEIGFSFRFDLSISPEDLLSFAEFLKSEGFYY